MALLLRYMSKLPRKSRRGPSPVSEVHVGGPPRHTSDASALAALVQHEAFAEFGTAFARSFAEYTYQVMRRLQSAPTDESDSAPPVARAIAASDLPPWVRDEYEKMRRGEGRTLSNAAAAALIMRNRLQRALREKDITQAELARRIGSSPAVISRVFKSPQRCRLSTLTRIARELGVEVADILRHT